MTELIVDLQNNEINKILVIKHIKKKDLKEVFAGKTTENCLFKTIQGIKIDFNIRKSIC